MDLKFISHIQDPDIEFLLRRIYDLIEITLKNKISTTTEFLNPYEVKVSSDLVQNFPELNTNISGGYPEAERKIIRIFPEFRQEKAVEDLVFFRIPNREKDIKHSDVLGSLLGLGIERKKIGDILIDDDWIQWIVKEEISSFIEFHLSKINRYKVKPERIEVNQLKIPKPLFKSKITTVSSLRLDSVISGAFNLSRGNAQTLIKAELVHVDFRKEMKPSFFLSEGMLISVRGKGRVYFNEILGKTKKGKVRILLSYPEN
ncbi:MAG: YlmH/Sll1252 family protein [Tissierellia bacterium]|nr:YlmH/Sll1252 family protein [Tissierellia bacterium]